MTLAEARVTDVVEIVGIVADPDGRSTRLEDLGFLVGTSVRVDRRAALGDPTIYELRGTRIALRRGDAALIQVKVEGAAALIQVKGEGAAALIKGDAALLPVEGAAVTRSA